MFYLGHVLLRYVLIYNLKVYLKQLALISTPTVYTYENSSFT